MHGTKRVGCTPKRAGRWNQQGEDSAGRRWRAEESGLWCHFPGVGYTRGCMLCVGIHSDLLPAGVPHSAKDGSGLPHPLIALTNLTSSSSSPDFSREQYVCGIILKNVFFLHPQLGHQGYTCLQTWSF